MMTKKHFIRIAAIIDAARNDQSLRGSSIATANNIASELATMFKEENPNFDRQRFIDACHKTKAQVAA